MLAQDSYCIATTLALPCALGVLEIANLSSTILTALLFTTLRFTPRPTSRDHLIQERHRLNRRDLAALVAFE